MFVSCGASAGPVRPVCDQMFVHQRVTNFTWIDGAENRLHVGRSAFHQVLRFVV